MEYIVDFKPYQNRNINIDQCARIEEAIKENKSISLNDAEEFLRNISYLVRRSINPNMDNFDLKCDLTKDKIYKVEIEKKAWYNEKSLKGVVIIKVAIISDIHGNSVALEEVLKDAKNNNVDDFSKNIVILTRNYGYRKNDKFPKWLLFRYRKYPNFIKTAKKQPEIYNKTLDLIKKSL